MKKVIDSIIFIRPIHLILFLNESLLKLLTELCHVCPLPQTETQNYHRLHLLHYVV